MFFYNITRGLKEYQNTQGAVLIDVREADEYQSGHIPGAVNIPVSVIGDISYPRETPLFLYCLSGVRSKRAVLVLKNRGYEKAESIGGIRGYRGPLE